MNRAAPRRGSILTVRGRILGGRLTPDHAPHRDDEPSFPVLTAVAADPRGRCGSPLVSTAVPPALATRARRQAPRSASRTLLRCRPPEQHERPRRMRRHRSPP
jgi:hypothetical protein